MITKQEMERVWNEEQPGWLKDFIKSTKGKKPFTLVARPYTRQYLDPIEITVYAKTAKAAEKSGSWQLSDAVRKQYPYKENPNMAWTSGVKREEN
jgi:hypothetical protein